MRMKPGRLWRFPAIPVLAVGVAVFAVLTFRNVQRLEREAKHLDAETSRDHLVLGRALEARSDLAEPELSILLQALRAGVTVTVHAALGAEIIHQHPATDGAAIGETSHRDFRRLAAAIADIDDGGVVLNLGSAVIMPEVFLKALTIARNLNEGRPTDFVSCDLDMQRHYRPRMNVVQRPTLAGGKGYEVTGHHEILVPLLGGRVVTRLEEGSGAG